MRFHCLRFWAAHRKGSVSRPVTPHSPAPWPTVFATSYPKPGVFPPYIPEPLTFAHTPIACPPRCCSFNPPASSSWWVLYYLARVSWWFFGVLRDSSLSLFFCGGLPDCCRDAAGREQGSSLVILVLVIDQKTPPPAEEINCLLRLGDDCAVGLYDEHDPGDVRHLQVRLRRGHAGLPAAAVVRGKPLPVPQYVLIFSSSRLRI